MKKMVQDVYKRQGGSEEFQSQGSTEAIADINPEDIESMSVLSGAAAAALYGSNAANGAIVITTKKGKVEMCIRDSVETALEMKEIFLQDQRESTQIFFKNWVRRSWRQKAAESIVRLLAPLLSLIHIYIKVHFFNFA